MGASAAKRLLLLEAYGRGMENLTEAARLQHGVLRRDGLRWRNRTASGLQGPGGPVVASIE